jgi:hypothetical protein
MSDENSPAKNGFFRSVGAKVGLFKTDVCTKKEEELSSFARIAKERGYINGHQAAQLTDLEDDPDNASSDIVVQQDWMTESQVEVVSLACAEREAETDLDDKFKQAHRAIDENHETMKRLEDTTSNGTITTADILLAKETGTG